jgi:sugar lactone lactonase YvrE
MKSLTRVLAIGLYIALSVATATSLMSCGGGSGGTANTVTPPAAVVPVTNPATLSAFVGNVTGRGNVDGVGAAARFFVPSGTAVDSLGNIYVADSGNGVIRKITPGGVVNTFAGSLLTQSLTPVDGVGAAAGFTGPFAITIDAADNLYVADVFTIRKVTPNATVTTLAGTPGLSGSTDGQGSAAGFNYPQGIAVDSLGTIYLADSSNNTIRKITPTGLVSTLAGTAGTTGSVDATGSAASFNFPTGLAVDSKGNVFVADLNNNVIRKITSAGAVSTFAGTANDYTGCTAINGLPDGVGPLAKFCFLQSLTIDSSDNIFVADTSNRTIRKVTPGAVASTVSGTQDVAPAIVDGDKPTARFHSPMGISIDRTTGNLYIVEVQMNVVRKVTSAGAVSTIAGSPSVAGSADGTGSSASFTYAFGVAANSAGDVFITDLGNNTIRKATPAGVVSTFAGTAGGFGNVDASGSAASFAFPSGITTDKLGNLYVCDRNAVRKITSAGAVTTLAGTQAIAGSADGTGAAASFKSPVAVAVDSTGNVFVVDGGNRTIRKITQAGVVTTFAGTTGISGSVDGQGTAARFANFGGMAIDASDNLYVTANHTVRKITPSGLVTTLAGMPGVAGVADGVGVAATFNSLRGIAVDANGNIYVADSYVGTIRKITPNGTVSTVVGVPNQVSFVPGALPGLLADPMGLAISGTSLYIAMNNGVAVVKNLP